MDLSQKIHWIRALCKFLEKQIPYRTLLGLISYQMVFWLLVIILTFDFSFSIMISLNMHEFSIIMRWLCSLFEAPS